MYFKICTKLFAKIVSLDEILNILEATEDIFEDTNYTYPHKNCEKQLIKNKNKFIIA